MLKNETGFYLLLFLVIIMDQMACKPGSVILTKAKRGDHSSGASVTRYLVQPTRTAAQRHAMRHSYLVLLQVGFAVTLTVASQAVRSYRTLSPLPF